MPNVNIGGTWKNMVSMSVNIDGVWKTVTGASVNIDGVWKSVLGFTPTYDLLFDTTVGTAVTSVDFSSLSLLKTDEILLVSDIVNTSASTSDYYLYFNNNTTATNYYSQRITASSTSKDSARTNNALMVDQVTNVKTLIETNIKLTNSGYCIAQNNSNENYGGNVIVLNSYYSTSTFTATSITQLTVVSSVASAIGIGSRFQLYRIGGA